MAAPMGSGQQPKWQLNNVGVRRQYQRAREGGGGSISNNGVEKYEIMVK